MGIRIKEIRLRNFRSYKFEDIKVPYNGVLIGSNNVGKTTLLHAFQVAFERGVRVSSEDIYLANGEKLSNSKRAIIDILIEPNSENDDGVMEFDDKWFEHFGELRSEDPQTLNQYVAIRTVIKFNVLKGEYDIERKALSQWPKSEEVEDYSDYNRNRITDKLLQSIPVFYLDAKRDISTEMKDKYSYWGKLVRDVDLTNDNISELEETLNTINEDIIENSSVLKHLSENLKKISKTVNSSNSSIIISPVSRKIRDLNRGMDITFKDQESESFPISNHGMGTRSWITFLTLVAYIEWKLKSMEEESTPYHPIILLEEPEAHLHPQAQRRIYKQIQNIKGQKLVSTHSPMIVAQADLKEIMHISKINGTSCVNYINLSDLTPDELRRIQYEVFKSRGDLLFANGIILCEGETEEQALPVFFSEYFGSEYYEYGLNIISVGGKGKYKPFLQVAKDLCIPFFILSDGEVETIKKVSKDIKKIFGEEKEISEYSNVKFLPNQCDFEMYLLNEGYETEILKVIEVIFGEDYLPSFIKRLDGMVKKREKTSSICGECNQNIFTDVIRDYQGKEGYQRAILDCIHDNKTAYSSIIADVILEQRTDETKVPSVIRGLFETLNDCLHIKAEDTGGPEDVSFDR